MFEVQLFHRGFNFDKRVNISEVSEAGVRPILYSTSMFDFGKLELTGPAAAGDGVCRLPRALPAAYAGIQGRGHRVPRRLVLPLPRAQPGLRHLRPRSRSGYSYAEGRGVSGLHGFLARAAEAAGSRRSPSMRCSTARASRGRTGSTCVPARSPRWRSTSRLYPRRDHREARRGAAHLDVPVR